MSQRIHVLLNVILASSLMPYLQRARASYGRCRSTAVTQVICLVTESAARVNRAMERLIHQTIPAPIASAIPSKRRGPQNAPFAARPPAPLPHSVYLQTDADNPSIADYRRATYITVLLGS